MPFLSAINHSGLIGLASGDDHPQYVMLAPEDSNRNVIVGAEHQTALTVRIGPTTDPDASSGSTGLNVTTSDGTSVFGVGVTNTGGQYIDCGTSVWLNTAERLYFADTPNATIFGGTAFLSQSHLVLLNGSVATTLATSAMSSAKTLTLPNLTGTALAQSSTTTTDGLVVLSTTTAGGTRNLAAGTNGHVLTLSSGAATWAAAPTTAPAGSTAQIQFNNGGAFGSSSKFTFNEFSGLANVQLNGDLHMFNDRAVYSRFSSDFPVIIAKCGADDVISFGSEVGTTGSPGDGCRIEFLFGHGTGDGAAVVLDGFNYELTIPCPVKVSNNVVLTTAGNGISIKEGSNATMGAVTLVAGTATVSTTKVTSDSRIFLTGQNSSGTHGELTISARSAGTSFTITSASGTDTRAVAWLIIEPS